MRRLADKIFMLALTIALATGLIITSFAFFILFDTSGRTLGTVQELLMRDYDALARSQVEQAASMLQAVVDRRDRGELGAEEAEVLAAGLLRELRYGVDGYFWADTYQGVNVVLLGRPSEGTSRLDLKDVNGFPIIEEMVKVSAQGGGFVDYWFPRLADGEPEPKRAYVQRFEPFQWIIGTGNYITDIEVQAQALRNSNRADLIRGLMILGAVLVVGLVILGVLSRIFGRRLALPMVEASNLLKELAEGDANLSIRLPVRSDDEAGVLSREFNLFTEKLGGILSTVQTSMIQLKDSSDDLSASAVETAAAVNQIAANIGSVKAMALKQGQGVSETSSNLEEITKTVEHFTDIIIRQAGEVQASRESFEAMSRQMSELSGQVNRSVELFRQLSEDSRRGKNSMDETTRLLGEISGMSQNLLETNRVIANIASQTNLLAMNAAIEAAHAGDAGRGFSVVADEIRQLAESASQQSKATATLLKNVKHHIDEIAKSGRENSTIFAGLAEQIGNSEGLQTRIQESLADQTRTNERVMDTFGGIARLSDEARAGSEEMNAGSQAILREMNNLVHISHQIQESMEEITHGTDDINHAINAISQQAVLVKEAVDQVQGETGRFKT